MSKFYFFLFIYLLGHLPFIKMIISYDKKRVDAQRVVSYKTFAFYLDDNSGTDYSGQEVSLLNDSTYIDIRQISDKAKDFIVYTKPHEYAIDPTTFFLDSTPVEYFRLPYQDFAPDMQTPEQMRFSWERDDSLDVDTYSTTNLDTLFEFSGFITL